MSNLVCCFYSLRILNSAPVGTAQLLTKITMVAKFLIFTKKNISALASYLFRRTLLTLFIFQRFQKKKQFFFCALFLIRTVQQ